MTPGTKVRAKVDVCPFPDGVGFQVAAGTEGVVKHVGKDGRLVVEWAASFTSCDPGTLEVVSTDLDPLPS